MDVRRFCLLGVVAGGLFACAAPPPPPKPAPPAPAPEPIDGVYRGTSTRFQADSRTCPHPGLVTFYVQDSQFFYRWDYTTWVTASIDPDGSVHGQADRITLVGKRNGRNMDGDVTNGLCGLHFTVREQNLYSGPPRSAPGPGTPTR